MSANPVVPTPAPTATDAIGAALAYLGPWGALAALAYKFGSPFVSQIIANAETGTDPTVAEWAKLDAQIDVPGATLIPQRPIAVPGSVLIPKVV
jgi:carbohydrate-selective porin OprB